MVLKFVWPAFPPCKLRVIAPFGKASKMDVEGPEYLTLSTEGDVQSAQQPFPHNQQINLTQTLHRTGPSYTSIFCIKENGETAVVPAEGRKLWGRCLTGV